MTSYRCITPDEPGSDVCGCMRATAGLYIFELDLLERVLLLASRSDDIDSETAAFVTELQEQIVAVRG